jgi:peptide/nickel transport system ATP-binding protein
MEADAPLLETVGLAKHFRLGGLLSRRFLHAVDDVDLAIRPSEIVALVGESGSGKSTIARLIAGVYKPTGGVIKFHGRPIDALRSRSEKLAYGGRVPMVFQDPYGSLSPVYRVSHGVLRALKLHRPTLPAAGREQVAVELFESVGLAPGGDFLFKYPYELSGGQRQRIGFAQALACNPELILADEPVSMLDASVRAQILAVLVELQKRRGLALRSSRTTSRARGTSPTV